MAKKKIMCEDVRLLQQSSSPQLQKHAACKEDRGNKAGRPFARNIKLRYHFYSQLAQDTH